MTISAFERNSLIIPKRKVFVSYHHARDYEYYREFSRIFSNRYEMVHDNSVDREIDSDNAEYVIRNIRENYIRGTSCTIVLCGQETPKRKFVDWEIKASLDKENALIGINLPTNPILVGGGYAIPGRLYDNYTNGYVVWVDWMDLGNSDDFLLKTIEEARSKPKSRIDNSRPLRRRNS